MAKTALVAGSTGLIGSQLLDLLLADERYDRVIAISRKPLPLTHARLTNVVCDLSALHAQGAALTADDVFCCLGTTIRKAKSKENFRAVDFEAPVALAQMTKAQGAKKYLLVSALGADRQSGIFYNQVKGEVEEAVRAVGFDVTHVLRPSLLMGPRAEARTGEEAAKFFFTYLGFLVPARYKGIDSIKVARAMIQLAQSAQPGFFIHESSELQRY